MSGKRTELDRAVLRALRHEPSELGLTPDRAGYCRKEDVLRGLRRRGFSVDPAALEEMFRNQRFGFDPTGTRVRADYGTSLGLRLADMYPQPGSPPPVLYHGSSLPALPGIRERGVLPVGMRGHRPRDHVFLTERPEVALRKGSRYGRAVAIPVRAQEMSRAGLPLYHAKDDIWLAERVPPEFLNLSGLLF